MGRIGDFIWRSRFFPRKLAFTREGKVVSFLSFGLGLAAINTGNNLLYLVFGLSLALIVASGILSEWNLRRLECLPVGSTRGTAGEPMHIAVEVRSRRARMPAFSIEAWPYVDDPACTVEPARFLLVGPNCLVSGVSVLSFGHRGEYRVRGMVLSTTFPFSFFRKSVVTPAAAVLLAHPRPKTEEADARNARRSGEDTSRDGPGRGVEFFGVRDFREGDNPRHIIHTLSARRNVPVVREFEDEGVRRVVVAVMNVDDGGRDGQERAEEAIERAAGMVLARIAAGHEVGLAAVGAAVPPGAGPAQALRIMDFLATLPVLRMNSPGIEQQVVWPCGDLEAFEVVFVRPAPEGR